MNEPSEHGEPRGRDSADVQQVIESDRAALAGEIHDGLLPYLFAAAASLDALRRSDPELSDQLADAANWVDQSRETARQLLSEITYPSEVLETPLAAAHQFIESLYYPSAEERFTVEQNRKVPSTQLEWSHLDLVDSQRLSEPVAIAIYRITTEAVRNALRHSSANKIQVNVIRKDDGTIIQISDNGKGFDVADARGTSHGLQLMHQRAIAAQCRLDIVTDADGTRVELAI